MGKIERRERALLKLLQTEEIPPPEAYPEAVTLPDNIMQCASRLVEATTDEGREWSINFRHRFGRWQGGLALRGTGFRLLNDGRVGARVHGLSLLSQNFYRPHLSLHTHPSPDSEAVKASLQELPEERHNPSQVIPTHTVRGHPASSYMLPGPEDIEAFSYGAAGTVGNIIATDAGKFLWLRTSVDQGPSFIVKDSQGPDRIIAAVAVANQSALILPPDEANQRLLRGIAEATQGMFVCYFSDNPESAELSRVL